MEIEMIRTFHPVGQGAFYSEEFSHDGKVVFRVVYDCGCINRKEAKARGQAVVEECIRNWKEHCQIDYLFISHFDYDHVSLLHVFKNANIPVNRVVLPLLYPEDAKFCVQIFSTIYGEEHANLCRLLIENPRNFFGAKTLIVRVRPNEKEDQRDVAATFEERLGRSQVLKNPIEVPSGTLFGPYGPFCGPEFDWCYVPRNFRHQIGIRGLCGKFDSILKPDGTVWFDKLMEFCGRRGFPRIKRIYDRLPDKINDNSMVVYSGPSQGGGSGWLNCISRNLCCGKDSCCLEEQILRCYNRGGNITCKNRSCRAGCMYTGDVNLAKVDVKDWYKGNWDCVGTIQVPHHGSSHSFSVELFKEGAYVCPISCSDEGYYGHPHASVTNLLSSFGNYPIKVTESQPLTQNIFGV